MFENRGLFQRLLIKRFRYSSLNLWKLNIADFRKFTCLDLVVPSLLHRASYCWLIILTNCSSMWESKFVYVDLSSSIACRREFIKLDTIITCVSRGDLTDEDVESLNFFQILSSLKKSWIIRAWFPSLYSLNLRTNITHSNRIPALIIIFIIFSACCLVLIEFYSSNFIHVSTDSFSQQKYTKPFTQLMFI